MTRYDGSGLCVCSIQLAGSEEGCARLDSIADDIRANKFSFDEAAAVISQDKDTRNNHGIMVNVNEHSGITTSKFQMQDLPQDVAKVVD